MSANEIFSGLEFYQKIKFCSHGDQVIPLTKRVEEIWDQRKKVKFVTFLEEKIAKFHKNTNKNSKIWEFFGEKKKIWYIF